MVGRNVRRLQQRQRMVGPQRALGRIQRHELVGGLAVAERPGVERGHQLLGDDKGVKPLRAVLRGAFHGRQLPFAVELHGLLDVLDEVEGLLILRHRRGEAALHPRARVELGQGGQQAAGVRRAGMAPGEILVPLRLGLDRLPAHRRLRPAEGLGRILPRRDDDRADREPHRRARQARLDGAGLGRLALRPAIVELIEPQRGVGRQRLEPATAGQRLVDHLLRRHFDQLDRHRLPIRRLLLLGVELVGQRLHQRGLLGRVGDGQ